MRKLPELKPVATRGVDHLAVVSDDMPKAMDFYTRVLGFQLVHVRRVPYEQDRGQPPYDNLRHYFFNMGNDSLFAVFEYPKGLPRQNRDHVGGMQHVAFHVSPDRFDALIELARGESDRASPPWRPLLVGVPLRSMGHASRIRNRSQWRAAERGGLRPADRSGSARGA